MSFSEKLKRFSKKSNQFFTESLHIVMIPHSGKNVRQLKFKRPLMYSLIILLIMNCTALLFLVYRNDKLGKTINNQNQSLMSLEKINNDQLEEITNLKNNDETDIVLEKLAELKQLEKEVRDLVGLKPKSTSSSTSSSPSRSASNITAPVMKLSTSIDMQTEDMKNLIDDVKKRLVYLEAEPNRKPVSGSITSGFGYRISPITNKRQFHTGIDIGGRSNATIAAAGSGKVTFSGSKAGYGRVVIISHGYGYTSLYAHNQQNLVKVGQQVKKGQEIAKLGSTGNSTGPHLHFEIQYNGKEIDPINILYK